MFDESDSHRVVIDSCGNYVYAPGKAVALVGVCNLVVVQTEDALLITTRERSQDVGKVVAELKNAGREDLGLGDFMKSDDETTVVKFGTDGWRGIIADDFTYANVRVAAAAIANYVLANEDASRWRVHWVRHAVWVAVVCEGGG